LAEHENHLARVETIVERIRKTVFSTEPAAHVLFTYENDSQSALPCSFQT
jgi:hypothetical protein